jgi:hypothetical protein
MERDQPKPNTTGKNSGVKQTSFVEILINKYLNKYLNLFRFISSFLFAKISKLFANAKGVRTLTQ